MLLDRAVDDQGQKVGNRIRYARSAPSGTRLVDVMLPRHDALK
jgi:hypothetical protein